MSIEIKNISLDIDNKRILKNINLKVIPGEILSVKEEYAQVRWRRPVPDVWLKLDQLKEYVQ